MCPSQNKEVDVSQTKLIKIFISLLSNVIAFKFIILGEMWLWDYFTGALKYLGEYVIFCFPRKWLCIHKFINLDFTFYAFVLCRFNGEIWQTGFPWLR